MAKQLTDEEVHLRRKLRHRLIGAAVLTLAAVVALPMVLDSEPKSSGQDIELRIPAPDKVGEFVPGSAVEETFDVSASAVSSGVPVISAVAAASAVAVATPPISPSLPIIRPASSPSVAPVKNPPVVAEKNVEVSKPAASVSSHEKVSPDAGFVAQVGAYSNADTAQHELTQLKAWGFKAYTEKVGDKIRVRVGPYEERDKAEKVRHLLENHGLHPVVTPVK